MKLSEKQQHVIDRMKDGWTLRGSTGLDASYWLSKKKEDSLGMDRETVSTVTIHALKYHDLIETASSRYPTTTYRLRDSNREVTAPVLVKEDTYSESFDHPAYGSIEFNNVHGTDHVLFGSSIRHRDMIRVVLSHAEKHAGHGEDRVFPRKIIAEGFMSRAQFAQAITGFGSGDSTPITLRFTENDGTIENLEMPNKRTEFHANFDDSVGGIMERFNALVAKAKDKNAPKWLVEEVEVIQGWLKANIPFLAEQFDRQMVNSVTEAKAEIEAYVTNRVQRAGLDSILETAPQIGADQVPLLGSPESACAGCLDADECPVMTEDETCPNGRYE